MNLATSLFLLLASGNDWDPARTWVFAVGILEWQDKKTFGAFPKEGRKDQELMDLFRSRGVPEDHILFLKDEEATRKRILAELPKHLEKAGEGDLLVFYYAGHGCRDDDSGAMYFANYDATAPFAKTGWKMSSVFDEIESKFRGSSALLMADCCYSGSIAVEARKRKSRVSYACLTSSLSSEISTGNWTFTLGVLEGFRGSPLVDDNGDGTVELAELGRYVEEEMPFEEEQLATFHNFADPLRIAPAGKKKHPRLGERLEVEWKKKWWKAKLVDEKDGKFLVDWVQAPPKDNEWVTPSRLRPFKPEHYAKGTVVQVEWKKKWFPAKVLDARLGLPFIRYDGFGEEWNEWVSAKRIKKKS